MYGLRKIRKNGNNYFNDFVWPLEVGAEVEAPDWNPEPVCGGGLHCLPNGDGNWDLFFSYGHYWAVLEFDEKDMVLIDSEKCKVKKCKIVFISENPEGMLQFFDYENFNSRTAFHWARHIGNQDIMISKIVESEWAYKWAFHIGNRNIMINRITTVEAATDWALFIGDCEKMIEKFQILKKTLLYGYYFI